MNCNIYSAEISETEMTEIKSLLSSVSTLQETKRDKQLKSVESRKDKDDAEEIRRKALQEVLHSENPIIRAQALEEEQIAAYDAEMSRKRKSEENNGADEDSDVDFEFGPKKGKPSNAKHDLLKFLEKKSEV